MYERMLNKQVQPTQQDIEKTLGSQAAARLLCFESALAARYALQKQLVFPFGNKYGWGYKYGHNKKHLCHAFFESGAFNVMLQIGDKQVPQLEQALPKMMQQTQALWQSRYPCGERGGWVHYRVLDDAQMQQVLQLIGIKQKPMGLG